MAEKKDTIKKSTTNLIWPKRNKRNKKDSGTQEGKVVNKCIDLTGKKVPVLDKRPVDKIPASLGEVRVSPDLPCEVVLRLPMPGHVDRPRGYVDVHQPTV